MATATIQRKQQTFYLDISLEDFYATTTSDIKTLWKIKPDRIRFYLHLYKRAYKKCQHSKVFIEYIQNGERLEIKPTKNHEDSFQRFLKAIKDYTSEYNQQPPFLFCCKSPGNKDAKEKRIFFKTLVENHWIKKNCIEIRSDEWIEIWNDGKSFHLGSWTKRQKEGFIIDLYPEEILPKMEDVPLIVEGAWNRPSEILVEDIDNYSTTKSHSTMRGTKTTTFEPDDTDEIMQVFKECCIKATEKPLDQNELRKLLESFRKLGEAGKLIDSYEAP